MPPRTGRAIALLATLLLAASPSGRAGALTVELHHAGQPVAEAVLTLAPLDRPAEVRPVDAVMDQVGSEFTPRVLVVPKGSRVSFPNSDLIRHQVYSFSPAKRFELPLYTGTPPDPVVFDRAGVVVLGCNIHDWMRGTIVVVDTPHHALSDAAGRAVLAAPPGRYRLAIWHERLDPAAPAVALDVVLPATEALRLELALAPPPPPRGSERLRALQERFRGTPRE
jgi:plastocyanin